MYRGLIPFGGVRVRPKTATKTAKYGVPNKVHSTRVANMNGLSSLSEDYFGPVPQGQTWSQYETFMSQPIATAGGAMIGLMIAGPIGAVIGGVGSWVLSGASTRHTNKPKIQGG